ncbi:class II fumarate hydratase [Aerococcus urinaehominis]|uniref:Fumarate hydratase class II n=1 Tax=Aerococcus urinaehominis TaxID=128944 RepID=A0A109RH94_9LACT|nr:class II fumarate hydratase [Aerococcus urinaehominis]AMB99831.1 class II fumarate hydratase [Aerococcus urinaehominis]SDM55594.1 fumarase, class II [Aerococcus urinaehominis]
MTYRTEFDSLGPVEIPADKLWGAQTQRSLNNFPQNVELMPKDQVRAVVVIKKAAAQVNLKLGKLDEKRSVLISQACDQVLAGDYDDQFPLTVWQTGSGTQTNMNVNEVIAHLANQLDSNIAVHPNDHVNMSQSSNDVFPTAMHIAVMAKVKNQLLPVMADLVETLNDLADTYQDVVKTGRTHLQDATPISLGQEISAWAYAVTSHQQLISQANDRLGGIPIGGTAVGTGLNAPADYDTLMSQALTELTGLDLYPTDNKFYGLASKGFLVSLHASLKDFATDIYKIANDLRFLSSGPRTGIGEISLPANEPGSSIMPGKVNPTQIEAITMICGQVLGNDVTVSFANSQGQAQLNAYMPVIIYNLVQSIELLSQGLAGFNRNCLQGIQANQEKISEYLDQSLMLVTALSPEIGYDQAAELAKYAHKNQLSLRAANQVLGYVSDEVFDKIVDPRRMV